MWTVSLAYKITLVFSLLTLFLCILQCEKVLDKRDLPSLSVNHAAADTDIKNPKVGEESNNMKADSNIKSSTSNSMKDHPRIKGHSADANIQKLNDSSIIVISTVDGLISAFSLSSTAKSHLKWQFDLGRPLLSQSISQLVHHDGTGAPYRIIPSLDGGLFKLQSASLQSLPVTADSLLTASYKLSDSTFIVGSRETVVTGLELGSGRPLYQCTGSGCRSLSASGDSGRQLGGGDGVLLVRQLASTVRAVHSAGQEDWNFQVAECDLTYHPCGEGSPSPEAPTPGGGGEGDRARQFCSDSLRQQQQQQQQQQQEDGSSEPVRLRFDVSTGTVYTVSDTGSRLWQFRLKSPIAHAWQLGAGSQQLRPISVFDMRQQRAGCEQAGQLGHVYVGQFRNQFYVQSQPTQLSLAAWAATQQQQQQQRSRPPVRVDLSRQLAGAAADRSQPPDSRELVLRHAVHASPGFYPVRALSAAAVDTRHRLQRLHHLHHLHHLHAPDYEDDDDGVVYEVINNYTGSLWHYWPQIIILSVLLSVLCHLFLAKVVQPARQQQQHEQHLQHPQHPQHPHGVSRVASVDSNTSSSNTLGAVQPEAATTLPSCSAVGDELVSGYHTEFVSRYHTEFAHVRCLGKGGFGLVFEAKHIIDDCSYAIKRVAVRNSHAAKQRILREVKALAKLDHHGIVRYYQAWFECPPAGWQEQMDASILQAEADSAEEALSDTGTGAWVSGDSAPRRRRRFYSDC